VEQEVEYFYYSDGIFVSIVGGDYSFIYCMN